MPQPLNNAVTLLGVKGGPALRKGSPIPTSSRLTIGGKTLLIDCGIGATRALVDAGTSLLELDGIFITHLHSDHLLDLGPLLYTAWTCGLQRKIKLFGPPGIEDYWQGFLQSMSFDHDIRTQDEKRTSVSEFVEISTFGPGQVTDWDGITVTALRVDHPPVLDCFALKFETPEAVVVFSADTCYFPPLADFAKGADILVHEAMLGAGIDALVKKTPGAPGLKAHLIASHTIVEDVAKIARDAEVGHLVLHHLVPADDPNFTDKDWIAAMDGIWDGPVTVGHDGLTVPLKPEAQG